MAIFITAMVCFAGGFLLCGVLTSGKFDELEMENNALRKENRRLNRMV